MMFRIRPLRFDARNESARKNNHLLINLEIQRRENKLVNLVTPILDTLKAKKVVPRLHF